MLSDYAIPRLPIEQEDIENMIFMLDGAPPHIYRPDEELLTVAFQYRVISRHFAN